MNWRDRLMDAVASIHRIAVASVVVFIFLTGLYSCAVDMVHCAPYEHENMFTPEICQ